MKSEKCPQCGTPLDDKAPEGLCPGCLIKAGLGNQTGDGLPKSATAGQDLPPMPNAARAAPLDMAEVRRRFPQLEIIAQIGRGGMGIVFKALQPQLDRFVALKILPAELALMPGFAERFTREARLLAKLNHPNIVAVFDFGHQDDLFYFIMEFVDGVNLRQLIASKQIMPEIALVLVPKICEALQFAHDEGILHRDIKPENILVDKKGRVKIADFGIAKLIGAKEIDHGLTATGATMGSACYMAPEQIEHTKTVDHRADIYSLGVVFYEMLTGELPMGRFMPPSKKVQVDVRIDEVVLHALEKEPEQRYQHVSEIKTDVEHITQQNPPAAAMAAQGMEPRVPSLAAKKSAVSAPLATPAGRALGWLSLALAIAGLVPPVLFGLDRAWLANGLHLANGYFFSCWVLGFVLELAALGSGILARRTGTGKAGLIISSLTILFYILMGSVTWPAISGQKGSRAGVSAGPVVDDRKIQNLATGAKAATERPILSAKPSWAAEPVVEGVGWGQLKLGMSEQDMFKLMGSPDGRDKAYDTYRHREGAFKASTYKSLPGVTLITSPSRGLFQITFYEASKALLQSGVGIGSPMDQALKIYAGGRTAESPTESGIECPAKGVTITCSKADGKKVRHFFIFARPGEQ